MPSSDEEVSPFVNSRSAANAVKTGSLSLEISSNSPSLDPLSDNYQHDRHEARLQHWRESPFAAGLVERTWVEEGQRRPGRRFYGDEELNPDETGCLCCSAMVCPLLNASRVGNMAVLRASSEWVETVDEDEETGERTTRRYTRPRLDCVVGPYWPMMCFITYPLILAVSGWTFFAKVWPGKQPFALTAGFLVLTSSLILALAFTACCDPGIQHKHARPPPQQENSWRWSDRTHSYRPRKAFYDADTAVIIEGFDHTCPWTGTAIGRKNMFAFQMFVCLVFLCMMMDIFILTGVFEGTRY
jgi:hypothetical protein